MTDKFDAKAFLETLGDKSPKEIDAVFSAMSTGEWRRTAKAVEPVLIETLDFLVDKNSRTELVAEIRDAQAEYNRRARQSEFYDDVIVMSDEYYVQLRAMQGFAAVAFNVAAARGDKTAPVLKAYVEQAGKHAQGSYDTLPGQLKIILNTLDSLPEQKPAGKKTQNPKPR